MEKKHGVLRKGRNVSTSNSCSIFPTGYLDTDVLKMGSNPEFANSTLKNRLSFYLNFWGKTGVGEKDLLLRRLQTNFFSSKSSLTSPPASDPVTKQNDNKT